MANFETLFATIAGTPMEGDAIETMTEAFPAQGTPIATIISMGIGNAAVADRPALDNAARLVSAYRKSLDGGGQPQAIHTWFYNEFNCYLLQRAQTLESAMRASDGSSTPDTSRESEELAKMTMFKNKRDNAQRSLDNNRIRMWLTFAALVVYTFGIGMLISGYTGMDPLFERTLKVGLSAVVLVGVIIYNIVRSIMSLKIETFTGDGAGSCSVFTSDDLTGVQATLLASFQTYLETVMTIEQYHVLMDGAGQTVQASLASNVLNDYENENYVNMRRFELINFKLENTNFQMRFLMYGFVIVSIMGLVHGSTTREGPMGGTFKLVSVALLLMYFSSFLMHYRNNLLRRRYNYMQMYWSSKNLKND